MPSLYFNSLPHAEVDVVDLSVSVVNAVFQLTTSRRGRPEMPDGTSISWTFQLTTSRRGRLVQLRTTDLSAVFQLTTSRRGRPNNSERLQN